MEEYRNARLGTYLVKGLTKELLTRNIIPFYFYNEYWFADGSK